MPEASVTLRRITITPLEWETGALVEVELDGIGIKLDSTLTATDVADRELADVVRALDRLVRARVREQAARAWAVAP